MFILTRIALGLIAITVVVAGYLGLASKNEVAQVSNEIIQVSNKVNDHEAAIASLKVEPIGATIPIAVARFESSLQSSISDTATSMTLVSGTDSAGNALSGYMCFTIDEGTSVVEDVCGTASGTAVSSLTRGISPTTGTSSVASLKFAHRRGASVKITDHPHVALHGRLLNGNETLPSRLVYDSSIATSTFTTYNLVNKQYVDGVALQGAPTATGTTPGIVELSTRTQLSAGTAQDGAYTLVPSNGFFTYNPVSATSVPVSNASGKIAQGWLDLTAPFTFTGALTVSATSTTLATTSITGLTVTSTAAFSIAPTAPTSTPAGDTTLITKYYADLLKTMVYASSSSIDVSSTASEVTVLSTNIPGNSIAVGGGLRVTLNINDLDIENTRNVLFKIKYGGTTACSFQPSSSGGHSDYVGQMSCVIYSTSSASSLLGDGLGWFGNNGAQLGGTIVNINIASVNNTLAVDSTSAQTLSITIQPSLSSASTGADFRSAIIEKLVK